MQGGSVTLEQHLAEQRRVWGGPEEPVGALLLRAAEAARRLSRAIRKATLTGTVGLAGGTNVTGDAQKKLDVIANKVVLQVFEEGGLVAAVVSEELPEVVPLGPEQAPFVLCVDPLDGSSNADINGAVGTIFGLYRRVTSGPFDPAKDLLRRGSEQSLAGYVMYGPSTLLVYTAGHGVHALTLDVETDAFVLTHENIRCPTRGATFSSNLVRRREWRAGVQRFVAAVSGEEPVAGLAGWGPWSLRYTGALVADMHRSLLEGGIYFYPADHGHADGKLRLLYECAPLAWLAEQAGGAASTGSRRILDVRAETVHQRVPLAIGSAENVALYETFFGGGPVAR
jgi:fructose-1,6-bisphosphatase I